MSDKENVRYEVANGVATITLDRPKSLNSLTTAAKEELLEALERARADAGARAVLLTGAGRAFCAGQDLDEHGQALSDNEGLKDTVRKHYNPIVLTMTRMPKPIVAAVNGVAAGAGAALAFACDLRVASTKASFLMAFANVGLGADSGASWTLPRLVGQARAMEMLLLAEPVKADRALEIGLVNRVVEPEELEGAARELAERLASGPTVAYSAIKAEVAFGATLDLPSALDIEARLQDQCAETADHLNATLAFLEKQRPTFQGR
ncbi:enoyl-CoA hydratase/isomerase family protein [Thermobifida halotolerans]|uniref:Enoyl-CoA hydratase/isomerase family protein n=1 Tax=Thermobifida halotolerans TaxID=483545 RepID=A0A399G2L1_9ACTN|nr:enoyl-CoA hydratase-related protein [Thermobifida halotolerans]UOE19579.1 enoyl-CoA hydratase/isomerase family protein [Thermobifida halotolerans]